MMRLTTALACLLLAPAALAAEPIHWPSPFTSGTVLTYRETIVDRTVGDDPVDVTTEADVTVRLLPAGNVQRWEWGPERLTMREGSATARAVYDAMMRSPSPPLDVQLDANGRYAGVVNADAMGRWLRGAIQPAMTDAMAVQLLEDGEANDAGEARMLAEAFVGGAVDVLASTEGVEMTTSWVPTLFNAWLGGTWEAGRAHTVAMALPSDTLFRTLPATVTYRVTALDGGKAQLAWSAEAMQGRVRITDTGVIRFDRTSGVPEFFEALRTEGAPGETSTTRTTYALQSAATP